MKKILIIEDETDLCEILEGEFREHGFEIKLVTEGGQMAFDAVKAFRPDLVLLDLLLPKMHGFEIIEELKSDTSSEHIPIVVLSNLDREEDIKKSLMLGAADYFVKSQHHLKDVIQKIECHADK